MLIAGRDILNANDVAYCSFLILLQQKRDALNKVLISIFDYVPSNNSLIELRNRLDLAKILLFMGVVLNANHVSLVLQRVSNRWSKATLHTSSPQLPGFNKGSFIARER